MRQQFSVRDLSHRTAFSVDSITDYNDFYSILSHRSHPVLTRCNIGFALFHRTNRCLGCVRMCGAELSKEGRDRFGVGVCLFW